MDRSIPADVAVPSSGQSSASVNLGPRRKPVAYATATARQWQRVRRMKREAERLGPSQRGRGFGHVREAESPRPHAPLANAAPAAAKNGAMH